MAVPGETLATGASPVCPHCGTVVRLEVLQSAAGYYIGTQCRCGPYTRESGYYVSYEEARVALLNNTWEPRGLP